MFWKALAIVAVVAMFYVGSGLHQSDTRPLQAQDAAQEVQKKVPGGPRLKPRPLSWQHVSGKGLEGSVLRSRIPGGWLVVYENQKETTHGGCGGITFVPDTRGLWSRAVK